MIHFIRRLFAAGFGAAAAEGITFHPSQTCPECGSKLFKADGWGERPREPVLTGGEGSSVASSQKPDEWLCPNPDCPNQVRRGLVHWCSPGAMDIPGGDAAMVEKLVARGLVRDVAELYRLKATELASLPGMDKDSAQKFFDGITASMKRDAWRVLFGLGIPLVAAAEAQALGKGFPTVDAVLAAGVPHLMKEAGVSESAARKIVWWSGDSVNRKLIKRLFKFGVNFKSELYQTQVS